MRRIKVISVILLSVMLIVGMALLPRGIAGISDLLTNGKPGTVSMQTVELSVYSHQTDEPGYMMRKLALEQRMTTIPIRPEQAAMTEKEVITAAMDGMMVYTEAKMFEWFEHDLCIAQPYLGIDPEDKSNNTIFWGVSFSHETNPYHSLFLHIDDETGEIIYIYYETYGADQYNYYYPENQRLMMEGFVDAFLRPLNLTFGQLGEYKNLQDASAVEQTLTDDTTCVRYTFDDARYGTIHIQFHITPHGFYVHLPNE